MHPVSTFGLGYSLGDDTLKELIVVEGPDLPHEARQTCDRPPLAEPALLFQGGSALAVAVIGTRLRVFDSVEHSGVLSLELRGLVVFSGLGRRRHRGACHSRRVVID
eukprot:1016834-Prymnesium_polylepis.2